MIMIMKKFFICYLLSCLFFCGCNIKSKGNDSSANDSSIRDSSINYSSINDFSIDDVTTLKSEFSISQYLNVDKEQFVKLRHIRALNLNLSQYPLKIIDSLTNRQIISCAFLEDNVILEIYPDNESKELEIGLLNLHSDMYRKIGNTSFAAAYGNHSVVLQERFYITNLSYEKDGDLFGKVLVYDLNKDILTEVDEYETLNIVQYITPVKDNGFAYCYYEVNTQDWVVKYFDINKSFGKEIFRYSNYTGSNISPMALTVDDEEIALVMQCIKESKYHTMIAYINKDTGLNYVEELNLSEYFGDNYEIIDFVADNEVFYLKTDISGEIEWHIFKRKGNKMQIVLPAICHLNDITSAFSDSFSNTQFYQCNEVFGDLIDLNISKTTFNTYKIKGIEKDKIDYIRSNGQDIIIILKQESDVGFKYIYATDYNTSYDASRDNDLFIYPQDEYDRYEVLYLEKAEGMQETAEETLKLYCENDYRWKYLFGDN